MLFALVATGTNRALVVCVGDYPDGSACREYQNNYEVVVDGISYGRLSYTLSRVFGRGVDASSLILQTEREYAKLPVKTGRPVQKLDSSVPESLKNRIIAE